MILKLSKLYFNIKIYLSHYDNKYYGFNTFFYIKDILINKYNIDYVIIINDNQIYPNDWIKKIYILRTPKTFYVMNCKQWNINNLNYFPIVVIRLYHNIYS